MIHWAGAAGEEYEHDDNDDEDEIRTATFVATSQKEETGKEKLFIPLYKRQYSDTLIRGFL